MADKEKLAREVYKVVDEQTERPTEVNVRVTEQKKRLPLPQNIMVFQKVALLTSQQLSDKANRVLMFFFSLSAYENYFSVDVKTIAEELNKSESTVKRGIQELEEYNIIAKFPHPNDHRRNDYYINPHVAWKGNSFARQKALRKLEQVADLQLRLFPGAE